MPRTPNGFNWQCLQVTYYSLLPALLFACLAYQFHLLSLQAFPKVLTFCWNFLNQISISLFSAFVHSHPVTAGLGCLPWMVILLSLSSSSLHCYNHHHCHHHQKDDKIERLSKESPQVTFSPPRLPGFTRRPGPPCLGQSANTKVFPSFWGFFLNNYFQTSTSVWIIAANKEVKTKRNI